MKNAGNGFAPRNVGHTGCQHSFGGKIFRIKWPAPEVARAALAQGSFRFTHRWRFASNKDPESRLEIYLIPDDPAMSSYDRYLVKNGHKPGVLDGRIIPKGEEYQHAERRQALIRRMERRYRLQPYPVDDQSASPTWARVSRAWAPQSPQTEFGLPVRVVIADRETAAKAADELYFRILQLYRAHTDWGETLQYVEAICMHFDVQTKRKWPQEKSNRMLFEVEP